MSDRPDFAVLHPAGHISYGHRQAGETDVAKSIARARHRTERVVHPSRPCDCDSTFDTQ